jgi:hypothetical protein
MSNNPSLAIKLLAFPFILTFGIVLIPVVRDYTDHTIAEQAVQQSARWFLGHLVAAIGFVYSIISVQTVEAFFRSKSKALPAFILPVIALGAGLYAAGLGADGIGPLAVKSANFSPTIFFDGGFWVTGTFMSGTILFGLGLLSLVGSCIHNGIIMGKERYIISISALIFIGAPAIPSGWGLYAVSATAFGIFIPLAKVISE